MSLPYHEVQGSNSTNGEIQFISVWHFNAKSLSISPISILYKSTAGRYQPVRVADRPITARCWFIKNAYWGYRKALCIKVPYTVDFERMRAGSPLHDLAMTTLKVLISTTADEPYLLFYVCIFRGTGLDSSCESSAEMPILFFLKTNKNVF